MDNPLLDFSGLPRFAQFKPEFVTPAVDKLLLKSAGRPPRRWLRAIAATKPAALPFGRASTNASTPSAA